MGRVAPTQSEAAGYHATRPDRHGDGPRGGRGRRPMDSLRREPIRGRTDRGRAVAHPGTAIPRRGKIPLGSLRRARASVRNATRGRSRSTRDRGIPGPCARPAGGLWLARLDGTEVADPEHPDVLWRYRYRDGQLHISRTAEGKVEECHRRLCIRIRSTCHDVRERDRSRNPDDPGASAHLLREGARARADPRPRRPDAPAGR